MEKVVKVVDEKRGIVQITTPDERWYGMQVFDHKTNLPIIEYVPSVTWICSYYPKGVGFYKWLAEKGWDESQAIKEEAGERGSRIHHGINLLLEGLTISMDQPLPNPQGVVSPLTLEEYQALMSFAEFHKKYRPVLVAKDLTVWNQEQGYCGTLDVIWKILPEFADKDVPAGLHLTDYKSAQGVWPSMEIQVSSYRRTPEVDAIIFSQGETEIHLSILQVGYKKNKRGYKLTVVPDQIELFAAARTIWANETAGQIPLQRDYPMMLKLDETPKPEAEQEAHAVATD